MIERKRRNRKQAQAGITLIEMLVALSVISIAVVGIAYGFSAAVRSSGEAQTQATLDGAARYLADYLQASTPDTYEYCATSYATPAASTVGYTGLSWKVMSVAESSTASLPGFTPQPCTVGFGRHGRTTSYDYGVQEITITVVKGPSSLNLVVWKEAPWEGDGS